MADPAYDADDLSELWGPREEGALEPAEAGAPERNGEAADQTGAYGSGLHSVEQELHDGVASLAEAIASHQADVIRRPELDAARSEIEGAFTQQMAVALYQLLGASNDRFTTAEGYLRQRLDDVAGVIAKSMEDHANRLAASIDAHQRTSMEAVEAIRAELEALRASLTGPVDAMASVQRDLRHEVGRLGDVVAAVTAELSRRSDADAENLVVAGVQMSERIEASTARAAKVTEELSEVSQTVVSVRDDVTALHKEIVRLRESVERKPGRARRFQWPRPSTSR